MKVSRNYYRVCVYVCGETGEILTHYDSPHKGPENCSPLICDIKWNEWLRIESNGRVLGT
jgi:hypothetical protein